MPLLTLLLALRLSASAAFSPTASGLRLRRAVPQRLCLDGHSSQRLCLDGRSPAPQLALRSEQQQQRDHRPVAVRATKPLLVPALGYAGLAGAAIGTQQLLTAAGYSGATLQVMHTSVPVAVVAVLLPALVLLGEFLLLGGGERVAKMMGGRPADPALTSLCSRVAERAGLPPPAHVYEIPTSELNAFAAGFGRGDATVAVTSGLRRTLSTRELEAVIAHELGHIRHSDMSTNMHVAVAIAGLGGLYHMGRLLVEADGKRGSSSKSSDEDGGGGAIMVGLALMLGGAAARSLAHLLQLSISRNAEYDADRVAAELCGADAMISALSKIDSRTAAVAPQQRLAAQGRNGAFAHAYISNGQSGEECDEEARGGVWQRAARLLSTHPPTQDRIAALRAQRDAKRD